MSFVVSEWGLFGCALSQPARQWSSVLQASGLALLFSWGMVYPLNTLLTSVGPTQTESSAYSGNTNSVSPLSFC